MSIKKWLRDQKTHFLLLSVAERRLLLSFFLFALAAPMTNTYVNTFLWRVDHDPKILILYNIAFYLLLAPGFYLNGVLLRYSETPIMYLIGCVLQGLVPLSVVMMGQGSTELTFVFGSVSGLAAGFFWANRNYLVSKLTKSARRFYFISTDNALGTLAGIAAPATIGWFLIFGEVKNLYSIDTAYHIAAVVGLIILFIAGLAVVKAPLPECINPIKHLLLRRADAAWNRLRVVEVFNGLIDGVESVVPVIMVLTFLGTEETIGTIDSLSAVLAAILIYVLGRRLGHRHHFMLLCIWVVATLIGSGSFAIFYSAAGVLTYYLISALVSLIRFGSLSSIMYETVDDSAGSGIAHRYVYIVDREFFLNAGRVTSLLILYGLYTLAPEPTLRFSLLAIVVLEAILLVIVKPLTKKMAQRPVVLVPPSIPGGIPEEEAAETMRA
ncbi:MAG: MFS transporter [Patescibacteria group bacterium]